MTGFIVGGGIMCLLLIIALFVFWCLHRYRKLPALAVIDNTEEVSTTRGLSPSWYLLGDEWVATLCRCAAGHFGITLRFEHMSQSLLVSTLSPIELPDDRELVSIGDAVRRINGKPVAGLSKADVIKLLAASGPNVELTLRMRGRTSAAAAASPGESEEGSHASSEFGLLHVVLRRCAAGHFGITFKYESKSQTLLVSTVSPIELPDDRDMVSAGDAVRSINGSPVAELSKAGVTELLASSGPNVQLTLDTLRV